MNVKLDLNNPDFQEEWFVLQKEDFWAPKKTFQKLSKMTWDQVYRDQGLKWEKIHLKNLMTCAPSAAMF